MQAIKNTNSSIDTENFGDIYIARNQTSPIIPEPSPRENLGLGPQLHLAVGNYSQGELTVKHGQAARNYNINGNILQCNHAAVTSSSAAESVDGTPPTQYSFVVEQHKPAITSVHLPTSSIR